MFEVMVMIVFLILINILVTLARLQQRKWLKISLFGLAILLLFPALLFGVRMILN